MLVEQLMPIARKRLIVLGVDAIIADAAVAMARPQADLVIVCQHSAIAGVVTKSDLVGLLSKPAPDGLRPITDIMSRNVIACSAGERLIDVWCTMNARCVQRIPVLHGRTPTGVIYARDALQALLRDAQHEDEALRAYVQGVGYH